LGFLREAVVVGAPSLASFFTLGARLTFGLFGSTGNGFPSALTSFFLLCRFGFSGAALFAGALLF
jgi:hypothetical protein